MNPEWDEDGSETRAIREWPGDDRRETKLEWVPLKRQGSVTDALDKQTIRHIDPQGADASKMAP